MNEPGLLQLLTARFSAAIRAAAPELGPDVEAGVRPAGDPRFGDYQCNAALALAKTLRGKPREIAEKIAAAATPLLSDIAEPLEIAGAGFINIRLKDSFLAARLEQISDDEVRQVYGDGPQRESESKIQNPKSKIESPVRLGIPPVATPQTIVVDYSSPNVAKQMHVGHLRGTILGDCLVRVLSFQGHSVIRQNHVGDWGTQFGILIEWYRDLAHPLPTPETTEDVLAVIEDDYRAANERFKTDPAFADAARAAVGRLQSGDPDARRLWERLYELSKGAFNEVYRRLDVLLTDEDIRGESFYNDRLAPTLKLLEKDLAAAHVAQPPSAGFPTPAPASRASPSPPRVEMRMDQGALCLFFYTADGQPLYLREDGGELPMIVQKSDGAFLYASTDFAALRYRLHDLHAARIIYVVGNEQGQHLNMLFTAGRAAGWAGPDVRLEHAGHGLILGTDRKRLRTRDGGTVKLKALLDEAVERARAVIDENEARKLADRAQASDGRSGPDAAEPLGDAERQHIAERVGIAAVKYADLSRDRAGDYIFDFDKMLAMQGNTAPYMLYAYARIRSIYRKAAAANRSAPAGPAPAPADDAAIRLTDPAERTLALRLARFPELLAVVAAELAPHTLCSYLYELAGEFNRFYEACPVLQAPDDATRLSRLRLCDLTARTLKLGLWLLGIETIERM